MSVALISHPYCLLHDMGVTHPERPARLQVIEEELKRTGLYDKLEQYTAPLATRAQLLRVHDSNYIASIFQAAPEHGLVALDEDTRMNPHTLTAALYAAGAAIYGVDLVLTGEVNAVFCNVRPPGHHAERARAMGFCIFNNLAVAVAHALEHYHLNRVAIVDFDVHHGNGTENIFQNDERVLFCSSFEHPFYPFSGAETLGSPANIPLPAGTTGDVFRDQIEKHWLKTIDSFHPEMIFFSAGFDAYFKDDMADWLLHEEDYAWLTQKIKYLADRLCHGRIVSVLEGGYSLEGLGPCVAAHVQALLSKFSRPW